MDPCVFLEQKNHIPINIIYFLFCTDRRKCCKIEALVLLCIRKKACCLLKTTGLPHTFGAPRGTRTPDLLIRSFSSLYRANLKFTENGFVERFFNFPFLFLAPLYTHKKLRFL